VSRQVGCSRQGQRGFSLFEILIAMVLLAMVAAMLYSVLNVGIKFTERGGSKILAMERKYAFLSLVQRQIASAVYDSTKKKTLMWADEDSFKVVTRSPYVYSEAGVVLAIYRYNPGDRAIYYIEKRDYFNTDYGEDYLPDFAEMSVLAWDEDPFAVQYDPETSPEVVFSFRGEDYALVPKCTDEQALQQWQDLRSKR